jgi:glycosyltransferase involved in cell wall biosynthesis
VSKKISIVLLVTFVCTIILTYIYVSYVKISYFNENNTSSVEFLQKIRKLHPLAWKISKNEGKFRVVLASPIAFLGEAQVTYRLGKMFNKLGWEWCISNEHNISLAEKINPDLFISFYFSFRPLKHCENMLCIGNSPETYKSSELMVRQMVAYDNFLQVFSNVNELEALFKKQNRKLNKIRSLYLSVEKTEFCSRPKRKLFYCGANWDPERGGRRYANLYRLLDKTGYFETYGPKYAWEKMSLSSYKGVITPSAVPSLNEVMQKAGVALVLHTSIHRKSKAIAARIFEAAAASCVIICDEHKFVKDNFGDSVLYIDITKSPEEIFKQIDAHMQWILKNPEKAIELARRSHKIFVDNFTLEKEVEKIKKFYDQIVAEKKGQKAL